MVNLPVRTSRSVASPVYASQGGQPFLVWGKSVEQPYTVGVFCEIPPPTGNP